MLDRGDHIVNQIISDNNHGNIVGSRGIIMYINDINLIKLNIFSTLPTAAAPHRCLIFGQKWRSVELCRSDRIIRNEESKAGTTIG